MSEWSGEREKRIFAKANEIIQQHDLISEDIFEFMALHIMIADAYCDAHNYDIKKFLRKEFDAAIYAVEEEEQTEAEE